uniref:Uncharacterized protein n=1 Tax=Arundo donax TaxID=35708 RepID=A0A0A9FNH3_ARUDO
MFLTRMNTTYYKFQYFQSQPPEKTGSNNSHQNSCRRRKKRCWHHIVFRATERQKF